MTCAEIAALAGAITMSYGGDFVTIAPAEEAWAQVCYHNSGLLSSISDTQEFLFNGVVIRVAIRAHSGKLPGGGVSPGGAETFEVHAPNWLLADPSGVQRVLDGQESIVFLYWAAS